MSEATAVPFTVGKLTVLSLGSLVDSPQFYRDPSKGLASDVVVYPLGYKVQRDGPAKDAASGEVPYVAEIRANEDGSAPLFVVTPSDCVEDSVSGTTPTASWQQLLTTRQPGKSSSVTGLTKFGLNDKRVIAQLRLLSGGEELFSKLETVMEQRPGQQRPQRNVAKTRVSFSQEQNAEQVQRTVGGKTKRDDVVEVDGASQQAVDGEDVQVLPINLDADEKKGDALPAKKPRKPRAKKDANGTTMVQCSITEMLAGAKMTTGEGALATIAPALRPVVDKNQNSKAKTVFLHDFENDKELKESVAKLQGKGAKRLFAQFMFQYTSEKSKIELAKRHAQVQDAIAKQAATAAAAAQGAVTATAPTGGNIPIEGVEAPTEVSMNIVGDAPPPAAPPAKPSGKKSASKKPTSRSKSKSTKATEDAVPEGAAVAEIAVEPAQAESN